MSAQPVPLAPAQPWAQSGDAVLAGLGTHATLGLTGAEVLRRRELAGPNALPEPPSRGIAGLFADQFRDVLIYLLLAAAAISVFVGELLEAVVIGVIIVINAIIGVVQAYRADQALAALQRMASPMADVIRDGDVRRGRRGGR